MKITILSEVPRGSSKRNRSIFSYLRQAFQLAMLSVNRAAPPIARGPQAVEASLVTGLQIIGQEYVLNPSEDSVTPFVGVLSNTNALRWAIEAKRAGQIEFLVAGPNLVVTPSDDGSILLTEAVDKIVTPSRWVSDYYLNCAPQLAGRVFEWAAGVDTEYWKPKESAARRVWLIYDKCINGGQEELSEVLHQLTQLRLPFERIVYGEYSRQDYREALQRSFGMIVVSASESQGLAQFEAWACDVPTLVWHPQKLEVEGIGSNALMVSSSPYLSDECGARFSKGADFQGAFSDFKERLSEYSPRRYVLRNFTLEQAAFAYVELFDRRWTLGNHKLLQEA
jgi:hypothetical protein